MKLLIVEDDLERIKQFKEWFKDVMQVDITALSKVAAKMVRITKYDVIFLDHDLGVDPDSGEKINRVYLKSGEHTGYEVAEAISDSVNSTTTVILHTYNNVGAKNMNNILKTSFIYPFRMPDFMVFKDRIQKINDIRGRIQ